MNLKPGDALFTITTMITESIQRLNWLCANIPLLMERIPEQEFSQNPAPDKWSKKQILGHLIDSATNNHQRFVRIQFEESPKIAYDQNNWVNYSYHQTAKRADLIALWKTYNIFLTQMIACIPEGVLQRTGLTSNEEQYPLEWFVNDYVRHMEHHLKQIVDY